MEVRDTAIRHALSTETCPPVCRTRKTAVQTKYGTTTATTIIYLLRRSSKTAQKHKRHTYNTLKKKAIYRNKTIKSIKHLHIIAAKCFQKYSLIRYSDAETRLS